MKPVFLFFAVCIFLHTQAQKYVLLDKRMYIPPSYANNVSFSDASRQLFAIEKRNLPEFLQVMDTLTGMLTSGSRAGASDFSLGNYIKFHIIRSISKRENRMDIVLTSYCDAYKFSMHLSDARLSNLINAGYLKTWTDYIKNSLK